MAALFLKGVLFSGVPAKWFEVSLNRKGGLGLYIVLFLLLVGGLRVG